MTAIKRLHTAAVDVAFAHGHVETELECAARERAGDHVREIAMKLDAASIGKADFMAHVSRWAGHDDCDYRHVLLMAQEAYCQDLTAKTYRAALELALRSHGRFKAYVEAKRALEACEAPKDA